MGKLNVTVPGMYQDFDCGINHVFIRDSFCTRVFDSFKYLNKARQIASILCLIVKDFHFVTFEDHLQYHTKCEVSRPWPVNITAMMQ